MFDLRWNKEITYRAIHHEDEVQFSRYNFEVADVPMLMEAFRMFETECRRLIDQELALPAYDYCIKTSHLFNILDARKAISVTERTGYITRVRALARLCAERYLADRKAKGFPLLKRGAAAPQKIYPLTS